jgi:hypothetical protein
MGGALSGMLAGLQPLIHRAFGIAGGGQVMRQKFGLALDGPATREKTSS